jgi:hypothetical protein
VANHTGFEQIEHMRQGVAYTFPVVVRGFKCMMRPLSVLEIQSITAEVAREIEGVPTHARNKVTEHLSFAVKCLVAASTSDPDTNDPQLTEMVLKRMTPDELDHLYKEWTGGCDRCNPMLESLNDAEVQQLVEAVKKKGSLLIELSFWEAVNVCRALLSAPPSDS